MTNWFHLRTKWFWALIWSFCRHSNIVVSWLWNCSFKSLQSRCPSPSLFSLTQLCLEESNVILREHQIWFLRFSLSTSAASLSGVSLQFSFLSSSDAFLPSSGGASGNSFVPTRVSSCSFFWADAANRVDQVAESSWRTLKLIHLMLLIDSILWQFDHFSFGNLFFDWINFWDFKI